MKMLLVGLGGFGYDYWYKKLKSAYQNLEVALVDRDAKARDKIDQADHFYTSLTDAIEREKPDFLLNATPPAVHSLINNVAFDYKLPVLCEKPISDRYDEAIKIVERATRENIPLMIAENYRYIPFVRRAKQLITDGTIGDLSNIH